MMGGSLVIHPVSAGSGRLFTVGIYLWFEILFVKRMVLLELVLWIRSVYDRISSLKLGLDSALKFQNVKQKKIW